MNSDGSEYAGLLILLVLIMIFGLGITVGTSFYPSGTFASMKYNELNGKRYIHVPPNWGVGSFHDNSGYYIELKD